MERKTTLVDSARKFLEKRAELYNLVINLPEYIASGATLYPHDIIINNYPIIVELLQASGSSDFLREKDIETVLDVGGANGDLSFV
jgi:hypothetical protein